MNLEKLVQTMKYINEVFDNMGIDVWMIDGTLLGMVRDKKLISWDTDIDLAMWKHDFKPPLLSKLSKHMKVYWLDDSITVIVEDFEIDINFLETKDGFVVDLYSFPKGTLAKFQNYLLWCLKSRPYESKKDIIPPTITKYIIMFCEVLPLDMTAKLIGFIEKRYINRTINYDIRIPEKYYKNLKEINFYGVKFKAPLDSQGFLTYKYGPHWKTPQKRSGLSGGFLAGSTVKEVYGYKKGKKIRLDRSVEV